MHNSMTDIKKTKTALEFLNQDQGFELGDLYLAPRNKEIAIVGQTKCNDPDNLNKRIAIEELEEVKTRFNYYRTIDSEFDKHFKDKKIKYCLAYAYGMGGIELCNELNGKITWSYEIQD